MNLGFQIVWEVKFDKIQHIPVHLKSSAEVQVKLGAATPPLLVVSRQKRKLDFR